MSEMVERVRKAICDARGGECSCIGDVQIARAAIAAMREPTEAMESAGSAADRGESQASWPVIWPAMIDAALKD